MRRKEIRNSITNNRVFDALYEDGGKISLEVKLGGRHRTTEKIDLEDVLTQIEEGRLKDEIV